MQSYSSFSCITLNGEASDVRLCVLHIRGHQVELHRTVLLGYFQGEVPGCSVEV